MGRCAGRFLLRFTNWKLQSSKELLFKYAGENDPARLKRALDAIKPVTLPVITGFKEIKMSVDEVKDAEKALSESGTES